MIKETHRPDRTVVVPPWPNYDDDPRAEVYSPLNYDAGGNQFNNNNSPFYLREELAALQRYVPSNEPDVRLDSELRGLNNSDSPVNASSCNHFRMFEFKVRRCGRGKSHNWVECPYAHPGEKARRRDPRKYHYSCNPCPVIRNGNCRKGDSCEFAHGVFECWLHPDRYRTQLCKDGLGCKRRRVCFFAHTQDQLRIVESADSYGGSRSPCRSKTLPLIWSSPGSGFPPVSPRVESSPPDSPMSSPLSHSLGSAYMNEMVASFRNLKLSSQPLSLSWNAQVGCYSPPPPPGFGSPRAAVIRPGFCSLPNTPTCPGIGYTDLWDKACEEEAVAERVESGRNIRAMMLEKLSKENSLFKN